MSCQSKFAALGPGKLRFAALADHVGSYVTTGPSRHGYPTLSPITHLVRPSVGLAGMRRRESNRDCFVLTVPEAASSD
eukprot:445524-Hanusia_phi.AAC.1